MKKNPKEVNAKTTKDCLFVDTFLFKNLLLINYLSEISKES